MAHPTRLPSVKKLTIESWGDMPIVKSFPSGKMEASYEPIRHTEDQEVGSAGTVL